MIKYRDSEVNVFEKNLKMSAIYDQKKTVLIIEDEEIQRRILKKQLKSLGYHVLSAVIGKEGLKIWRKDPEVCILNLYWLIRLSEIKKYLQKFTRDIQSSNRSLFH